MPEIKALESLYLLYNANNITPHIEPNIAMAAIETINNELLSIVVAVCRDEQDSKLTVATVSAAGRHSYLVFLES